MNSFPVSDAWAISAVCLYSTGHPIGGTVALFISFIVWLPQ